MAVNLCPPEPSEIYSVPGVVLGGVAANIRKPNRNDVLVVELALDSASVRIHVTLKIAHPVIHLSEQFLGSHLVLAVVGNTSFG